MSNNKVNCSQGDRLVKKLTQVCGELVGTLSNLKDLEDSIEARHPGTIETFKREFERRGGEQFRPNSDIFKCMFSFFDAQKLRFNSQGHRSYG